MNRKRLASILKISGNVLILVSLMGLFFTFGPVTKQEVEYQINRATKVVYSTDPQPNSREKKLEIPNTDFSVVVPKIGAAAPVVAGVDANSKDDYLAALRRGVAHAAGTALPGENGNTYIFAHSTDSFYNVGAYNAVFYLLGKLNSGDEIMIYHHGEKYVYIVQEVKVVEPEAVVYLYSQGANTLTLQTCYPPGTTLKRLVVVADLKS